MVVVVTAAPLSAQPAAPQSEEPEGDTAAGERVFRAHCAMCHGDNGSGMMGMHPSVRGAVTRLSREGVEITIRNGRRTEPPMPAWEGHLSDAEIDDLVAYVASLPDGPRNFGPGTNAGMGGMTEPASDGRLRVPIVVGLLVVLAAVAAAAGWAVSQALTSPCRTVARRYAAGQVCRDEWLQQLADLGRGQRRSAP